MSQIAPTRNRLTRLWLAGMSALLCAAALVPAAHAATQVDLRSPDARDAARALDGPNVVDLRSPDARDAARAVAPTNVVDLRSPDARDAGRSVPSVPVSSGQPAGGFDWGYLAIGGTALILLLGAGGLALRRRTPQRRPAAMQS